MCDPMTAMVVSAVGTVASAGINYMQQSDMMSKQQQANDAWVAWQRDQANQMWQKEDAARQKAEAAQQETLGKVSPEAQKAQQTTEEARLNQAYTPASLASQTNAADLLLSGQKNASPEVQGNIAKRVTQAAQDARQRIAALATIQSYGPSFGGLQQTASQAFAKGGQDIALQGDIRQGNLAAYQVAKNVEPLKYVNTPSPWGSLAQGLAGIAGSSFGNYMGGNMKIPQATV